MKRLNPVLGVCAFTFFLAQVDAAISVGPAGVGPLTFSTNPIVSEFSTTVLTGTSITFVDATTLDAAINSINVTTYSPAFRQLPQTTTYPPVGFSGGFQYNAHPTQGAFIQSRPVTTGTNAACLLLGQFRNDTGSSQSFFVFSYDFSLAGTTSLGANDELPGLHVYYSLTGTPGSWQPIPSLTATEFAGNHSAILNLGTWPTGALLYLLWADDNDDGHTDPAYTIDNFRAGMCVSHPFILQNPSSTNVSIGDTIRLSVQATGSGCGGVLVNPSYQWHKVGVGPIDSVVNPSAATATLVISNAALSDTGDYFVIVSNPAGGVISQNAHVNVAGGSPPQLISASVLPSQDNNWFEVVANKILCTNGVACGSHAQDPFTWEIRPVLSLSPLSLGPELNVLEVFVNGGRVTFMTMESWEPGRRYRILVSSRHDGISDVFGNFLEPGNYVDALPTVVATATQDAEIHSNASADTPLGQAVSVKIDNDDNGIARGLLRFENLVGNGPGQVPLGSQIASARLSLRQVDAGSVANFHRMLIPWDEATVTWNSLVNGVTNDGIEARIPIDASSPNAAPNGVINLDVTTSVAAWAGGQPNHGWAILSTGTDGWAWESSESINPPILVVTFVEGPPCNPVIFSEPAPTISVAEGAPFSISVGVSNAFGATFQWMKNGVDIPGATLASYGVASASFGCGESVGDAGTYRLRIVCGATSVTSAPSVVTVLGDAVPPRLTGARVLNETNVLLEFSKVLNVMIAQDPGRYSFTPAVEVLEARASNQIVLLTTEPLPVTDLLLSVGGIFDNRACGNLLAPNPTFVDLTPSRVVVPWSASWLYNTNNLDATLSSVPWFASNYVPGSDWKTGDGLFGTETSATIISLFPTPIRTPLLPNTNTPPDQITYYFRKQIELPPLPPGARYALAHFIDDGAVFYLDGVEIGRLNMATPAVDPQISYTNRATTAGEAAFQCLEFSSSAGPHLLAVEVHQGGTTTSSDVLFGAQVIVISANSPKLYIASSGTNAVVTWSADSSWALQRANNLNGPFTAITPTSFNEHRNITQGNPTNLFFRLQYVPGK